MNNINFDVKKVAKFNQDKVAELIQNEGIIRNRLKIEAAINNASRFMEIQKEFGSFSNYVWSFVNGKPLINYPTSIKDLPAKTEISDAMSKDMGKRGFKFRGSTICNTFMKAVGMLDNQMVYC